MSVTWILKIYCNLIRTGRGRKCWEDILNFKIW